MKDIQALAYVNMFAVLGAIPRLCELSDEARALIEKEKVSLGFSVKDSAKGTLVFDNGTVTMQEGVSGCRIKLPFATDKKFCDMIDGVGTPIPSRGFLKIGFLLKKFIPLTDLLSKYLRPTPKDLENEEFFSVSTRLMLTVIGGAVCQLANHDKIAQFSASNIVDGIIKFSIKNSDAIYIECREGKLSLTAPTENFRAYMEFADLKLARDVFDGKVNSVAAVGLGDIRIGGMISMVDNVNRILDRVSLYLG